MKKNIMTIFYMSLITGLCYLPVLASTVEELEAEKTTLNQEIDENKKAMETTQEEIKDYTIKIKDIQDSILEVEQELSITEADINASKAQQEMLQAELEIAIENEEAQYQLIRQRIKQNYETSKTDSLRQLLEVESLSEFYKKMEYIKAIMAYDERQFNKLKEMKDHIEELQKQVIEELDRLVTLESEEKQIKAELNKKRDVLACEIDELQQYYTTLLELEETYNSEWEALDKKIEEAKLNQKYNGGSLVWPSPGYYRITSPFGNRIDPINGKPWYHRGIDLGVPSGSKIVAAADGQVIEAGWKGGYGRAVVINHGGLVTLYAHNSSLTVQEGDFIKAGEVIAYSGSSGRSTGPHLHFEVKANGTWQNPMDYFK